MSRWPQWSARVLLAALGLIVTLSRAGAFQPSQETINNEQRITTVELTRRVAQLELFDISSRLKVLESDMTEVKWLARGAALAVIGQLMIAWFNARNRQADE